MSPRPMVVAATIAAVALAVSACGASGDKKAADGADNTTTTTAVTSTSASGQFGDLKGVCGKGNARVKEGESGKGADKLYIGVATDRSSSIRPGLNKEMWDASVAFTDWCNAAGGIAGLKIEPVELDAALLDVPKAMTEACHSVFAMVGGGWAQDNLQFTGKDDSDFHKCGLVDIPGYAVSPEKADSNGQVQPVPNPGTSVSNTWIRDFAKLYPEQSKKVAIAYAQLPALEVVKEKYAAAVKDLGLDLVAQIPYSAVGMTDWTPLAQQVIGSGAGTLMWVGEAGNVTSALAKLKEQGWKGRALLETNMYDPLLFSQGDAAVDGTVVRMTVHPVEEASKWPATRQYLDLLKQYVPDAKVAPLGIQSMSAWLLFAVSADACAKANGGVIDRTCLLEQAAAQKDWTGGGLHSAQDPARFDEATSSSCSMLMIVKDGKFERLYPKLDGTDDDGGGFHCPANGVTKVPANAGKGVVDPNRKI
ncbi:MAG: ABC transporter substrate-binding protein [Actinobacteria bacterium]|nr:ABC transporter substrate-binding protein [Actinomycetota bacterium]